MQTGMSEILYETFSWMTILQLLSPQDKYSHRSSH